MIGRIQFSKMQGNGNDFVVIDLQENKISEDAFTVDIVNRICDRKFGIGADGLILVKIRPNTIPEMLYYNADGTLASLCGNGSRCFIEFITTQCEQPNEGKFLASDGEHTYWKSGDDIAIQMHCPSTVIHKDQDTYILDTGSPHYIALEHGNLETEHFVEEAKAVRYSDEFKAEGININWVNTLDANAITMRTYERGVENETLACGTGMTAAAIAHAIAQNLEGNIAISVQMPGGKCTISLKNFRTSPRNSTIQCQAEELFMIGPAKFVFKGIVEL